MPLPVLAKLPQTATSSSGRCGWTERLVAETTASDFVHESFSAVFDESSRYTPSDVAAHTVKPSPFGTIARSCTPVRSDAFQSRLFVHVFPPSTVRRIPIPYCPRLFCTSKPRDVVRPCPYTSPVPR